MQLLILLPSQELNALPFIAMASNGLGWVVYGIIIHDFFVYGGNVPGLLLGLFYVMTCYKYSTDKVCAGVTAAAAALLQINAR